MSFPILPELRIAASPALMQRGCVNLIRCDAIKAQAGARWDKIGGAVSAQLEALLRQKLGPSDFFAALDDSTFLVSMPSADAEAAQIACLRVAHELHTSFLGACKIGNLRITRAVAYHDDRLAAVDIDGEDLNRLAAKAGLPCDEEFLRARVPHNGTARKPSAGDGPPVFREMFAPMWDAQHEAVTAWRCVTVERPVPRPHDPTAIGFKLDLGAALSRIRVAAAALSRHLKVGDRFLIFVTVPYDVMCSPVGRMEIISACRGLSSALRPYLVFEIDDLPYGVPQSRLLELVGVLRPFCRAVAGQLPARISSYGIYQSAGLKAIGLSLSANGAATTEMNSEVFKLATAAKRLHILSFVLDAASEEAVAWSRSQGINFVSGPAVGALLPEPASVHRLKVTDIHTAGRERLLV